MNRLLFGLCFGEFLLRGDCGASSVNVFCVGVTVVWCVGVLSTLASVCLEVIVAVVHVEVPGCVSVVFCVCFGEGPCVGVFLWVFGVFLDTVAEHVCLGVFGVGVF